MVEKSSTCACCGQAVPSAGATGAQGRPTVRVDDDLLVLCNRAHEEARRRGSLRVEIAHVVWCLTIAPGGSGWIESVGLARHELALAADRWLCRADRAAGSAPLQTSAELKLLLREAERDAERAGHGFASPADVLAALIEHGPDLASGAFLAAALPDGGERSPAAWSGKRELAAGTGHTSAPCPGEARLRPLRPLPSRAAGVPAGRLSAGRQLRFDFSVRPRADEGEEEGGDDEAAAGPSRGAGLLERLSRQEHDLAQLRALVARLTERGEAAVAPALKAAPRAEAAVAAGSALAHADEAAPDAPAPGMPGSTRRPWRTRLVQRPLRPSRPSRSSPAVDAPPRGLGEPAPGICGDARAPMQVDEAPRLLQMAAEPAFVSRVEPMPGLPAAEGDLEDDGDSTGDRLKRFLPPPGKANSIAGAGQRQACRLADAAAGAGDDGDLRTHAFPLRPLRLART